MADLNESKFELQDYIENFQQIFQKNMEDFQTLLDFKYMKNIGEIHEKNHAKNTHLKHIEKIRSNFEEKNNFVFLELQLQFFRKYAAEIEEKTQKLEESISQEKLIIERKQKLIERFTNAIKSMSQIELSIHRKVEIENAAIPLKPRENRPKLKASTEKLRSFPKIFLNNTSAMKNELHKKSDICLKFYDSLDQVFKKFLMGAKPGESKIIDDLLDAFSVYIETNFMVKCRYTEVLEKQGLSLQLNRSPQLYFVMKKLNGYKVRETVTEATPRELLAMLFLSPGAFSKVLNLWKSCLRKGFDLRNIGVRFENEKSE